MCGLETFGSKGFLTRWEKYGSDCDKSNVGLAELSQLRALLLWLFWLLALVDMTLLSVVLGLEQDLGFLYLLV